MPNKRSVRQRIREAQEWKQHKILGVYIDRIRFGCEPWFKDEIECEVCRAKPNFFHVLGCCREYHSCLKCKSVCIIDCKCDSDKE